MEKEKKQIKISLWTFYVLIAGIVILIGAVIIGGMNIKKKMDSLEQGNLASQIETEKNNRKVDNTDKAEIAGKNDTTEKEENLKDVTLDDKDAQKCLAYLGIEDVGISTLLSDDNVLASLYCEAKNNSNYLDKTNISNDLILGLATNYAYDNLAKSENKNIVVDEKTRFSEKEIESYVKEIFGKDISYKHQDFKNGIQFGGSYPTFNTAKYNSDLKSYVVDKIIGDMESNQTVNLYTQNAQIQKNVKKVIITTSIGFEILNGTIDYYRVDFYKDFDITSSEEQKNKEGYWDVEKIVKNLIAHNYGEIMTDDMSEKKAIEIMQTKLAVNDGLGTIEENMDKLHKIKMTFTKDDSNEYHFESFEIID